MSDPTKPEPKQIRVRRSAAKDIAESNVRALLVAGGTLLAAKGHLDKSLVEPIAGVLLIAWPVLWGSWKAFVSHKRLKVTAKAAPDRVAVVEK